MKVVQTDPALSHVPAYPGRLLAAVVLFMLVLGLLRFRDLWCEVGGSRSVGRQGCEEKSHNHVLWDTPVHGEARHFLTRLKADHKWILGDQALVWGFSRAEVHLSSTASDLTTFSWKTNERWHFMKTASLHTHHEFSLLMSMAGVNTEEFRLNPNGRTKAKCILWLCEICQRHVKAHWGKGCKYQWACAGSVSHVLCGCFGWWSGCIFLTLK